MHEKLRKAKEMMSAFMGANQLRSEIDRLAKFIMEEFPDQPGSTGVTESAVDVAIRMLQDVKNHMTA